MKFFEDAKDVFFLGIGGIGISALARLFKQSGKNILGSDKNDSALIEGLRADGIKVTVGHFAESLPNNIDLLIYSEAIPIDNPELEKARELGMPVMNYFEALGKVAESYRLIAIAGTHGKTTTTAMLGLILEKAGLDPTVIIGTKVKEFGNRNIRIGQSDLMLVEACEYRRNFLSLKPELLGILNIELDHVDYFETFADYEKAFQELAGQSDEVIWPDDYSDYEGELTIPGAHNLLNAGMAANLARKIGVEEKIIAEALKEFDGTWRRFEYRGTCGGALVYDDYAHHPSEIQATLQAAREKHPDARIVAVFQPHQYSRTAALLDAFADSFEDADEVIIPNIYEARDSDEQKHAISAEDLVEEISQYHDETHFGKGLEATANYLLETAMDGDLILVMGAGDVNKLIPMILDEGA